MKFINTTDDLDLEPEHYALEKPPPGFATYTSSVLAGCKSHTLRVNNPKSDDVNEAEYYCTNSDCVVREVSIRVKLFGERRPGFSCPACGKGPLKFHTWLESECLFPVPGEKP